MRKLLPLLFLFPFTGAAQTPIGGVVNEYAVVTGIDYCAATVSVNNASTFSAGNRVLLIQMKGAEINASNASAFGTITNLNSAGLYEWGTVESITGNGVRLQNTLVNVYDITGNVQLIKVPQYTDAVVTAPLSAPAWNGNTGGVLVLEVSGQLTLQADVDLNRKGFRGGAAGITQANNCTWLANQNAYFYALNNWRGAAKGEGIAAFIPGAEAGRGAQANGGGGGNDHNSGGGGGGHLNAGGQGGNNNEPATFGCDGDFPGIGGRAVTNAGQRLFLGGGGGAGHDNNDLGTDGGNGGGIIFIAAGSITGNGFKLMANGASAGNSLSDGAGGGGAGGSIIISAETVTNLGFEAKGGNGGNADNGNAARCMGPGGGGAGGRIIVPAGVNVPAASLAPGQNGQSINSTACSAGPNGAQAGLAGALETLQLPFPEGNTPAVAPAFSNQPASASYCAGDTVVLSAAVSGAGLGYQWQVNTGSGFQDLQNGPGFSGAQTPTLSILNVSASASGHQFRLLVSSPCFPSLTSEAATLTVTPLPEADFGFVVNGNAVQFSNNSAGADTFQWHFGDGSGSQDSSPAHTYTGSGPFTVHLIAFNTCGADSASATITITTAPTAGFSAAPQSGCAPLTVAFNSSASANADAYLWLFPGGQPASSALPGPQVVYDQPGSYGVTLIVSNAAGEDTLVLEQYVSVGGPPEASFNAQPAGGFSFNFANTSQSATNYQWDFGDGANSSNANPAHTYASPGVYSVMLTAMNACGSDTYTTSITAGQPPSAAFGQSAAEGCAPAAVQFSDLSTGFYTTRQWSFPGGNPATSDLAAPTVIYAMPGVYEVTLTVDGPLGSATFTRSTAVQVHTFPEPGFTYAINGNTVTFENTSSNAVSYSWLFGDGNSSQEISPVHTYAAPGVYTVTLNAERPFCAASTSATVFISTTTSTTETGKSDDLTVFPNPAHDLLHLRWKDAATQPARYRLWNAAGMLVKDGILPAAGSIDLHGLPCGVYLLEVERSGKVYRARVVKV